MAKKSLTIEMERNKETKGAVRYGDDNGHSLYFRKEEVAKHNLGDSIKITVENTETDE